MSSTDYFQRSPKYTAQRLHSKGLGVESNPFEWGTADYMEFIVEMNKLELEEAKEAGRMV